MTKTSLRFNSTVEFANFGKSSIAYVRPVQSTDFEDGMLDDEHLDPNEPLWGLFGADGEPIAVADERSLLLDSAEDMSLVPVTRQ